MYALITATDRFGLQIEQKLFGNVYTAKEAFYAACEDKRTIAATLENPEGVVIGDYDAEGE